MNGKILENRKYTPAWRLENGKNIKALRFGGKWWVEALVGKAAFRLGLFVKCFVGKQGFIQRAWSWFIRLGLGLAWFSVAGNS